MAKSKASQLVTTAGAAEIAGKTERAIRAAIERGELTTHQTHCERATLLDLADVKKWAKTPRKRGRKPKSS